jgi:hypothetical protein
LLLFHIRIILMQIPYPYSIAVATVYSKRTWKVALRRQPPRPLSVTNKARVVVDIVAVGAAERNVRIKGIAVLDAAVGYGR